MNEWINKYMNISIILRLLGSCWNLSYYTIISGPIYSLHLDCMMLEDSYSILFTFVPGKALVRGRKINKRFLSNKLVSPALQHLNSYVPQRAFKTAEVDSELPIQSLSLSPLRFAAVACQIIRTKSLFVSMLILFRSLKSYFARMFCIRSSVIDVSVGLIFQVSQKTSWPIIQAFLFLLPLCLLSSFLLHLLLSTGGVL